MNDYISAKFETPVSEALYDIVCGTSSYDEFRGDAARHGFHMSFQIDYDLIVRVSQHESMEGYSDYLQEFLQSNYHSIIMVEYDNGKVYYTGYGENQLDQLAADMEAADEWECDNGHSNHGNPDDGCEYCTEEEEEGIEE